MSEMIQITAADGHQFDAYRVNSQVPAQGNVVLIQEIFGVNDHIRSVADGYAAEGFNVIAPAIFDRLEKNVNLGYDEAGITHGRDLKARTDLDAALLDIAATAASFANKLPCSTIGYCYGGKLAFAASRLDNLHACIAYYGGGITELLSQQVKCRVLLHFGELDASIPTSDVETIRRQCPEAEIHLYADADHGFNCDHRRQYHAASAALARARTLEFLRIV